MSYALLADLYRDGAPQRAFGQTVQTDHQAALDARASYIDSKLRGRYPDAVPLIAPIDPEIKRCNAVLAAYDLMNLRGYNPQSGADVNIRDRAMQAIGWLDQVQRQSAHPLITPAPTAPAQRPLPRVSSGTPRGF